MRAIDADDFENRMYHEVFEKDTDMQKWDSGCWVRYKLFENVLREQPTIEPQRKKGHWIKISPANIYECSECGKNVMTGDISAYDFCHGCGADMREPEDIPMEYFESGGR